MTDFRRGLADLPTFTLVLAGNQRVKVLAPAWGDLLEGPLGELKRALMLREVPEAAEHELREHPECSVLVELGEGAPEAVRQALDSLVQREPRLSYVVLPSPN